MDLMTIGAFAMRTRLSPKALRLYDRLGLVPPARTDTPVCDLSVPLRS
jgi:PPM family protein phosphatase